MAQRADMTGELPQIDVPTLVICGEYDVISPSDEMRSFAAALPNSQFVEVAGSGHMTPLEAPSAFNDSVLSFLG